ncbi:protein rolling stone-like isoform X1 [Zootermopsis nevadensis]|uniref:Protein rolling stone n=1 Tax=Zootermopsis nevadensis TaxID=136037 RepID=A0A067QSW7_ZOONE|nr:protein rolling stone-like isoform X1 [Zootermopsis nevadensis]KDR06548.1 Protein rolling stone [Zootermopsis nevadensis]
MKTILRQEINIRCLGFSHDRPEQFVRCQWQKNDGVSIIYLVYRWIFGILFLSVWIWSFFSAAQQNTPTENFLSKWPIYLTNWGYTLCTAQALLAAGLVTQQLVKERKTGFTTDHAQTPVIYKAYWLLHTLAVVTAISITGSYFVIDYDPAVHNLTALNLLMHAFNSILMVLDIILVAHPFRLIHFCWSLLFIFVYFCFSVIYHLAGGTGKNNAPSIYPALDWSKVESTLPIAILGMLAVILAHFCTWLAVIARNRIARSKDDKSEEPKISKLSSNQVQPMDVVMS